MIVKSTFLGQGCSWFRDRNEPAENDCTAPEPANGLGFELYEWSKGWRYSKYFICNIGQENGRFFPRVSSSQFPATKASTFATSKLGARVEASMKRIGFNLQRVSLGDSDSVLLGTWGNGFNQPFVQWGEIYEAADGREVLKWSTDLFLYTMRMIDENPRVWSVQIPAVVENMLYLAEANLKQSLLTMPRELSWDEMQLEKIPHPVLRFQDKDAALISRDSGEVIGIQSVPCETLINVAYDVNDSLTDAELDTALAKICDTFVELSTISVKSFFEASELEVTNFFDVFGCDEGDIYPLASHLAAS